jgi:hypothetical protein
MAEHRDQPHVPDDAATNGRPAAPYWLLRALCERVAGPCERGGDCAASTLCVTERCAPCAARWWLDQQHATA